MKKDGLTPRQDAFVREFAKDLNAAAAARRAGYSERTAKEQASRLLTNANVAEAIQKSMDARAEKCEITAERVLLELARIALAHPGQVCDWGPNFVEIRKKSDLDENTLAAVSEVSVTTNASGASSVKVKMCDKAKALELLGRHMRMFTDVLELSPQEQIHNMSDEELDDYARRLFGSAAEALGRTRN